MMKTGSPKVELFTLPVETIRCQACVSTIEKGLSGLRGIEAVKANLAQSSVSVKFQSDQIDLIQIKKHLDALDYKVPTHEALIDIEGMHCASCVARIEKGLSALPGVVDVHVNLVEQTARVEFIEGSLETDRFVRTIEDSGYKAAVGEKTMPGAGQAQPHESRLLFDFRIALVLTIIVFIMSNLSMLGLSLFEERFDYLVLLIFAIPVQFYCGRQFYIGFWKSLRRFSATMDTLVAVGTSAAFLYSVMATFFPVWLEKSGQMVAVYYDTSSIIITLILFGRLLESRARKATAYEIEKLVKLEGQTAIVERQGKEIEIDKARVLIGDLVVMKPGARLPVDGVVVAGFSAIDEAMLTGEPLPREIKTGDRVFAGAINKSGMFKFSAQAIGNETVLSQIIESVREIIASRAPIQRLADKVAAVFVPIVIIIAMLSFGLWMVFLPEPSLSFALMIFISVLIVACPCALGLATPTAIMVGSARGAREGILIKSAEILEQVRRIDIVVFDKTGTLSIGRPQVHQFINLGAYADIQLLEMAASLEKASGHTLAEAVLAYAEFKGAGPEPLADFANFPGRGVKGTARNFQVHLGNQAFLHSEGVDFGGHMNIDQKALADGKTILYLAVNGRLEALLIVADQIKPEAKEVVAELQAAGRSVWLLTGDNRAAAENMAAQLGIESVLAEVLPHDKAAKIISLRNEGHQVAMVGDGLNDAPALAAADVGIALGSGSDLALAFSDITLIGSNLKGVTKALRLSERTLRTIKLNLWWAFGYNVLAIPIAAGAFYPLAGLLLSPILASAAMAFSSILVVTNSLGLRKLKL